jgi:hypothetical protein
MIGTAFKVNIDAIAFLKHASTRLKQAIDAIGNREHSSIGMLPAMLEKRPYILTTTYIDRLTI